MKGRLAYALFAASATAAICTGLLYGYVLYFCQSQDPFSVVNHPLQPMLRSLHIVISPALIVMLGAFWASHAWPYIRSKRRKGLASGLALGISALPMIFSGYLLQVSVEELQKTVWVWCHVVSSLAWTMALLGHLCTHFARKRRHKLA